jgi:hypothetical protein
MWKKDKNVKKREMECIVRKRQWRHLVETDRRELVFTIRGKPLDMGKVDRWMAGHNVSGSMLYSPGSRACKTVAQSL